VLREAALQAAVAEYGLAALTRLVQERLDDLRQRAMPGMDVSAASLARSASAEAQRRFTLSPGPVINATGIIIHDSLGRAPLSDAAIAAMTAVAAGYSALDYDLDRGLRGSRHTLLAPHFSQLTGADDALVTNANAAGMMLVLAAIARGREVIVAHGQSLETGGRLRLSTVLGLSGAQIIEVGTTNRTRLADFAEAVTPKTAALLNIQVAAARHGGFVEVVALDELTAFGHRQGIPVIDDQESGCLLDVSPYGLASEPTVRQSVASGADLVCFSGDKLFGGPQCGVVVGGSDFIARVRRHPLSRALRADKITLAALHATALHYVRGEAETAIPIWRMLAAPVHELEARAARWQQALAGVPGTKIAVKAARSSFIGGWSAGETVPTCVLSLRPIGEGRGWAAHLAGQMRIALTPVLCRVEDGAVVLDPRSVLAGQDQDLLTVLRQELSSGSSAVTT
jgi:L-seryl-tRNA(Ser) seleniumtransferase